MEETSVARSYRAETVTALAEAGLWRKVFSTESFYSMPYGGPDITHRIHVYEVN